MQSCFAKGGWGWGVALNRTLSANGPWQYNTVCGRSVKSSRVKQRKLKYVNLAKAALPFCVPTPGKQISPTLTSRRTVEK